MRSKALPLILALACVSAATKLTAQTPGRDFSYDTGSNGSDGALSLTAPGTVFFDPADFNPPLDPDGDGIYHFTSITIGADTVVKLRSDVHGSRPVVWLSQGDVQIIGILDLNGEAGHSNTAMPLMSLAGAGGFPGGTGRRPNQLATAGDGPGGGFPPINDNTPRAGAGGGHAVKALNTGSSVGGAAYGNEFQLPMIGGSGGGGGGFVSSSAGGGGGGGGGALLLAANTKIIIEGTLRANGGLGGDSGVNAFGGGGGSGGSLRLIAPEIEGNGNILANGANGRAGGSKGARGRIRLETFFNRLAGIPAPVPQASTPGPLFLDPVQVPLRVVSVDGQAVPVNPANSFAPADVLIDNDGTSTVELAGQGVPPGTVAQVTFYQDNGTRVTVDSTPFQGTLATTTATAAVDLPRGNFRFYVQASW